MGKVMLFFSWICFKDFRCCILCKNQGQMKYFLQCWATFEKEKFWKLVRKGMWRWRLIQRRHSTEKVVQKKEHDVRLMQGRHSTEKVVQKRNVWCKADAVQKRDRKGNPGLATWVGDHHIHAQSHSCPLSKAREIDILTPLPDIWRRVWGQYW